MTSAHLGRLSTLIDEALDLEGPAREAWLAKLEHRDRKLGRTLRSPLLLGDLPEAAESLERGPAFASAQARVFAAANRIDAYRMLRKVGPGGMGEVWLAERAGSAFRRWVARKLPTLGVRHSVLVQRFARERDIRRPSVNRP